MENEIDPNGSFFTNLLHGDVVVWLDMDWETIFKLMAGLVAAIVVANVISKRI